MNPGEVSFDTNQHQNVGNSDVAEQEEIDGFLEWTFNTQN